MTKRTPPFSPEVRERAVRRVLDHQGEHGLQYAAICSIAGKIGCSGEILRLNVYVNGRAGRPDHGRARAPPRAGARGPRTAPRQRAPAHSVGVCCDGGVRPPVAAGIALIEDHREVHGVRPKAGQTEVGPICRA